VRTAVRCKPGFSSIALPRSCENGSTVDADGAKVDCPASPYVVLGDYCKFVDQQSLKLQENPETVPTGEMPRHVLLFSERYLVGRCVPGTRVTVTGIYTIFQNKTSYVYTSSPAPPNPPRSLPCSSLLLRTCTQKRRDTGAGAVAIRHPYLRVVGFSINAQGMGRSLSSFKCEPLLSRLVT
jgi:DNA replication licensing factor MCM5